MAPMICPQYLGDLISLRKICDAVITASSIGDG
jgi:hypothetical protein